MKKNATNNFPFLDRFKELVLVTAYRRESIRRSFEKYMFQLLKTETTKHNPIGVNK